MFANRPRRTWRMPSNRRRSVEFLPGDPAVVIQITPVERRAGPMPFVQGDGAVTIDVHAGKQLGRRLGADHLDSRHDAVVVPVQEVQHLRGSMPFRTREPSVAIDVEIDEALRAIVVQRVGPQELNAREDAVSVVIGAPVGLAVVVTSKTDEPGGLPALSHSLHKRFNRR
jgi:hypothetical protein